jgi:hypothetical protein
MNEKSSMDYTQHESKAIKMIMVHEDGTTKTFDKGFIVTAVQEEGENLSVTMYGCNISGPEMIDTAVAVLAPIAEQAFNDEEDI